MDCVEAAATVQSQRAGVCDMLLEKYVDRQLQHWSKQIRLTWFKLGLVWAQGKLQEGAVGLHQFEKSAGHDAR